MQLLYPLLSLIVVHAIVINGLDDIKELKLVLMKDSSPPKPTGVMTEYYHNNECTGIPFSSVLSEKCRDGLPANLHEQGGGLIATYSDHYIIYTRNKQGFPLGCQSHDRDIEGDIHTSIKFNLCIQGPISGQSFLAHPLFDK
ncbi:hypothetical protein SAMD00019534_126700, partial [Acytostelium subglobosum LB1]|uniref:hypothetical protein n=1 Tax=Acytostelium subglobosum LB1 TaxID=1410327 RepID=UPI000644E6B5